MRQHAGVVEELVTRRRAVVRDVEQVLVEEPQHLLVIHAEKVSGLHTGRSSKGRASCTVPPGPAGCRIRAPRRPFLTFRPQVRTMIAAAWTARRSLSSSLCTKARTP